MSCRTQRCSGRSSPLPPVCRGPVGIVAKAAQSYELGYGRRYDAILVDEGQDFTSEWWDLLRNSVFADDGETLVANRREKFRHIGSIDGRFPSPA